MFPPSNEGADMVAKRKASGAAKEAPQVDPWNPASLVVSEDSIGKAGVRKLQLNIPIGSPVKHTFYRAHTSPEFPVRADVVERDTDQGKTQHILAPEIAVQHIGRLKKRRYGLLISTNGVMRLWRMAVSGSWGDSALEAYELARSKWVEIVSHQDAGIYTTNVAANAPMAPPWEDGLTPSEVMKRAFGADNYISDPQHPILKEIMGDFS